MDLNEEVTDSDLVAVPEDFEPGDIVYIDMSTASVEFGTLVKSTPEELSVRVSPSKLLTFTATSEPSLDYALRHIGKPPKLNGIKVGDLLSRISTNGRFERFREYAVVTKAEYGGRPRPFLVKVEYVNPVLSHQTTSTYDDSFHYRIAEQMRHWTIEA